MTTPSDNQIARSTDTAAGQSLIPSPTTAPADTPRLLFNPPIDIYETEEGLVLYADLPGVSSEGLDLQVQDNRLTLFGRVHDRELDQDGLIHQEYQVGDFLRSFILSDEVDHSRIEARLVNGVLRIELPKAPRAKPRRIDVTTG